MTRMQWERFTNENVAPIHEKKTNFEASIKGFLIGISLPNIVNISNYMPSSI